MGSTLLWQPKDTNIIASFQLWEVGQEKKNHRQAPLKLGRLEFQVPFHKSPPGKPPGPSILVLEMKYLGCMSPKASLRFEAMILSHHSPESHSLSYPLKVRV